MAKTILEELMGMLDADGQAYIRYQLEQHPDIAEQDRQHSEIYSIYTEGATINPNPTPAPAHVAAPVVLATTYTPTTPNTTSNTVIAQPTVDPNAAISAQLSALTKTLETRLADLDKRYVPVEKIAEYRTEMLASSIKAADDYAQVRESHRAEFNEPINRTEFEKFVADQSAAGTRFASMNDAHNRYVADKRVALQIKNGIDEGLKQRQSAQHVPGQTQSTALSPAQQIMAKQRESAQPGANNNALSAAQRLADLVRARENAGAVN
jgi:hypothetical protein